MLIAAGGAVVDSDTIIDALWPDDAPLRVERILRPLVSRLRSIVGREAIGGDASGWWICASQWQTDVDQLRALAATARSELERGASAAAYLASESGLALLGRGEALPADRYDEWAQPLRRNVERMSRELRGTAALAALALGVHDRAAQIAEDSIDSDPLDEAAWRLLIGALHGDGRSAAALRAYERLRALLAEELGARPSNATEDLFHRVLADAPISSDVLAEAC
jgi:DNA-binding SARP family transcriptional activator